MLFLFGIVVLLFSVGFGYFSANGSFPLLWQPSEFLIILGSGCASVIIANPWSYIKKTLGSLKYLFQDAPYTKADYLAMLEFFSLTFKKIKLEGMVAFEKELDKADNVFVKKMDFIKDIKVRAFIFDSLRLIILGVKNRYHFEEMLENEIFLFKKELKSPSKVLENLADALPALGIVAAVLGVIISMKSIAEPPEVLGALIAAALVGTFAGVFFSYGLFGPIGEYLNKYSDQEILFLESIKTGFIGYFNGYSSIVITEIIRKSIPLKQRPSFEEVEKYIAG